MISTRQSLSARLLHRLAAVAARALGALPPFRYFRDTADSQVPVTLGRWFAQRVLGINGSAYWPMAPTSHVSYVRRIHIGAETSPGWSGGCYINGMNGIYIGDYTQISFNVGIISAHHDVADLSEHLPAPPIVIGRYCLLGMGCVIMPGVELGDYTMVGANSVVTRSFPDGHVKLGGVPAREIGRVDPAEMRDYRHPRPYHGYIPAESFPAFAERHLLLPPRPSSSPPLVD